MGSYQPIYLKSKNRKLVFDLFKKYEKLSRSQITKLTNMSFPTAMKVVDFLISKEVVHDVGELDIIEGPGRRSKLLQFNPNAYNAFGVEIEGQIATIGKVNLEGEVQECKTVVIKNLHDLSYFHHIVDIIGDMMTKTSVPVLGVGIGFPANINPQTNEIISYDPLHITEPISFYSLIPLIEAKLKLPFFIDNDVNLACAGENLITGDNADSSIVYISLGTGLGSGIIIEGNLWRGESLRAGEIGNLLVHPIESDAKHLPGIHNLEDQINIGAINKRFNIAIEENCTIPEKTVGDIVRYLVPFISTVIFNLVAILDVKKFILSGIIPQKLHPTLYDRLSELFETLPSDLGPISVTPPTGSYPVISGAASMVFEQTLFDEFLH
ncbi:ROK family protein [Sediminispirochaeta bajacaliforniensis]|uniref:ROK family protein n=1 Tax=Sediminispirochaeta bajacaliforniensis TaxID=148 RepID=UPI000378EF92|nr:ROK family protein [Sediminispirochaeta bajacaliforniensis]